MPNHNPVRLRLLTQPNAVEAGVTDMENCVDVMETVFELYNDNRVIMGDPGQDMHGHVTTFPGELGEAEDIESGGPDRRFSAMPAYVGGDIGMAGLKWYGSNVRNPAARGIPRSLHTITLNDPDSGQPVCVMDGQVSSAMRTGATAALGAAEIQGDRAESATIIGPGIIGQTSALGLDRALENLTDLTIYHPERWKAEAYQDRMAEKVDATIHPSDSAEAAVSGADVTVVAAAGDPPPAIEESWLAADTLVIPLGDLRMPLAAIDPDRVFCDIRENTLEFADGLDWSITNALGAAVDYNVGLELERSDLRALHEVVGGTDDRSTEGKSIFYSPGLPMEDVAWASEVYTEASELDIGETVTLFTEPYFSKPY